MQSLHVSEIDLSWCHSKLQKTIFEVMIKHDGETTPQNEKLRKDAGEELQKRKGPSSHHHSQQQQLAQPTSNSQRGAAPSATVTSRDLEQQQLMQQQQQRQQQEQHTGRLSLRQVWWFDKWKLNYTASKNKMCRMGTFYIDI